MTRSTQTQPEALRLAETLDRLNAGVHSQAIVEEYSAAAAELRRLYDRVAELEAQQESSTPVAWYVTGCSTMLDEIDAKIEAKRCGGSAKAVPLYTRP